MGMARKLDLYINVLTASVLCVALGSCMTAQSAQQTVAADMAWCKTQTHGPIDPHARWHRLGRDALGTLEGGRREVGRRS